MADVENPARWAEDPTGVFDHRYWDGTAWTDQVAAAGTMGWSPIDAPRATAEELAASLRRPSPTWPTTTPTPPPPDPVATGEPWVAAPTTRTTVAGRPVTDLGRRFGAYLLDILLSVVTCGIGWFVWAAVTAADGQTPGKRLMRMQVVDQTTGRPLSWPAYVLWRGGIGFVGGLILGTSVLGLLVYLMPLFNDRNQHFYGLLSNSVVVDV